MDGADPIGGPDLAPTTSDHVVAHPASPTLAPSEKAQGSPVLSPAFDASITSESAGGTGAGGSAGVRFKYGSELPEIRANRIGAPLVRQERPPPASAKPEQRVSLC